MIIPIIIGAIIGGIGGFVYHKLIGCSSGLCPLTANPTTSIIYGAILGALIGGSFH